MDDRPAVGYGLPGWLDTLTYLSAGETKALGEFSIGVKGECLKCKQEMKEQYGVGHRVVHSVTEGAHVVRVGTSGSRKRGVSGPTGQLCKKHHRYLDEHGGVTLALRRDGWLVWLTEDGTETVLAPVPRMWRR